MQILLIKLIIILSTFPDTNNLINASTVQEGNLIKLLTALANERLKQKSDSVKLKFWNCINLAGTEPRKYAKCLVRLMRSKNAKNFASSKSADELLAHDLALMRKFNEKNKVIKKSGFNLLTVQDKEVRFAKPIENTVDDQEDGGRKFVDDQVEKFQYMLNRFDLKKDRVSNILNQVSNLSRYITDRFPKSRSALSTTKNRARYQGSTSSARILSPRFFTMEDDGNDDQWTLLSPDMFSLYENNKTNNILSLPSLIHDVPSPEKSVWWKFIAEAVNAVKDDVNVLSWNRSLEVMYKEYGMDNATVRNKIIKFFDVLDDWQLKDLGGKGYTVLKDYQHNTLHRDNTIRYKMMGKMTMKRALEEAVLNIARGHTVGSGRRRRKRALAAGCILKPSVGNVIIFTHFIVSYIILCPAALGIFILGSLVLTPFILTPYVLFPFILSPFVLVPIILSPHALAPTILSPGVLSPFILDPNVLSPTILSPFVLCPFILSPSCLSPVILSPGVLSPAILSPSCLSPFILSPCALCG